VIPYVEEPSVSLGPLTLHAFGFLAALGILVGGRLATRAAERWAHLDPTPLMQAIPWAVAGGIIGGHLLHVLGYHPELLSSEGPIVLVRIWDGLSSMGGVIGGLLGFLIAFGRRRTALRPYLDSLALGVAPGWAIARVGCFLAHDHPGVRTSFFMAVLFPGGARHDLGLYDAIVLALLTLILYGAARRQRGGALAEGRLMSMLAVGYSVPRFFLDFLRARDVPLADGRIYGLTPAQYVSVILVIAGVALWLIAKRRRSKVRDPDLGARGGGDPTLEGVEAGHA
jgi:phosphatidylglycerol:prolipoprotein diacylglycerol transferase